MHLKSFTKSVVCLAVASSLYACGGSSGSSLAPVTDSANLDNPAPSQSPATDAGTTLVGRVADGYIRGATVCIDINENGNCDTDEPTATTGQGGLYELAMVAGAEGKPILADVPATAIDEDDNMPIGKRMMLSAPPSKREFISPITTLVHQELENNPAVDLDEAEAAVKQELGLSIEDEDASLFTDYVANGDEADSGDQAERFRHMHRTAQVVAKMMQEIQNSAESAVVEQGVDLDGDPAARKALQKAVRKEIRKLLPEIAEAVSDRIVEAREAAATDAESVNTEASDNNFDASQLAERFIPEETIDAEEIIVERDLPRVESVTVEAMLTGGFYWFDVHCSVADYEDVDYADEEFVNDADGNARIATQDFSCAAGYTHIVLGDDGKHISQTDYEYDDDNGVWVAQQDDYSDDNDHVWHLVDGQWVSIENNADATVEFTDDGGAIIEHEDGKMIIKAVQRALAGQKIMRHLYEFDSPYLVAERSDTLFPAESSEYLFKIKRAVSRYALFNWSGDEDGRCAEHNGNCNVVSQVTDNGLQSVESLDDVVDGVVLAGLLHNESDQSLSVSLSVNGNGQGWNKAEWFVSDRSDQEHFDEVPVCEPYDPEFKPDSELAPFNIEEAPVEFPVDLNVDGEFPPNVPESIEEELKLRQLMEDEAIDAMPSSIEQGICAAPVELVLNDVDLDADGVVDVEFEVEDADFGDSDSEAGVPGYKRGHSYGRWRTVEVDGVKMVELTLPFALRHNVDFDDTATVMLVEHDGFVRRGAHFSNRSVETETAYNPVAFEALLTEVEKQMGVGE